MLILLDYKHRPRMHSEPLRHALMRYRLIRGMLVVTSTACNRPSTLSTFPTQSSLCLVVPLSRPICCRPGALSTKCAHTCSRSGRERASADPCVVHHET